MVPGAAEAGHYLVGDEEDALGVAPAAHGGEKVSAGQGRMPAAPWMSGSMTTAAIVSGCRQGIEGRDG